jgi:hypothetical protein
VKPFYLSNRSTFQIQLVPLPQGRPTAQQQQQHALQQQQAQQQWWGAVQAESS